jgi:hypothetical protein
MSVHDELNFSRERSVVESVGEKSEDDASSCISSESWDDDEKEKSRPSTLNNSAPKGETERENLSSHSTGTHVSFVEHQFLRDRGNSSADEASFDTTPPRTQPLNVESSEVDDPSDAVVPADQERQILLLMLLAQVCALHDPTPRTFTVSGVVMNYMMRAKRENERNLIFPLTFHIPFASIALFLI